MSKRHKKRVIFFIDGFNVYHSLEPNHHKYKWLNYKKFVHCFIPTNEALSEIYFFTTFSTWNKAKRDRHRKYIKILENENIKVIYGKFKEKTIKCPLGGQFKKPTEKQTDVNIVTYILKFAIQNKYDKAYIISGDTDLIPAYNAIKTLFPKKEIGIIFPFGRVHEELKHFDSYARIKERHLSSSQFPDPVVLPSGKRLTKPPSWS